MQLIDDFLEGGIEKLGREHAANRESEESPPNRFRLQNQEENYGTDRERDLSAKASLGAERGDDPLEREAETAMER